MSTRNLGSLDHALAEVLTEHERRISELSRRRPAGTGSGVCDCEDGADGDPGPPGSAGRGIAVFEQAGEPTAAESEPGDVWIIP